jgi:hypothetical protein
MTWELARDWDRVAGTWEADWILRRPSTRQQKLLSGSDDGRWTVDDGRWTMALSSIVYRLSSIVTRTSNEYPQGCTSLAALAGLAGA